MAIVRGEEPRFLNHRDHTSTTQTDARHTSPKMEAGHWDDRGAPRAEYVCRAESAEAVIVHPDQPAFRNTCGRKALRCSLRARNGDKVDAHAGLCVIEEREHRPGGLVAEDATTSNPVVGRDLTAEKFIDGGVQTAGEIGDSARVRIADNLLTQGQSIEEVARYLEITESTYHRWRNTLTSRGDTTRRRGAPGKEGSAMRRS
jgi:hypothetical protein